MKEHQLYPQDQESLCSNSQTTGIEIILQLDSEECLPTYASEGAAGADIKAYIDKPITIMPGKRELVPTGIRMEIPEGYEVQMRPRSGLALKHGITLLNTPGTIDADYRGEVKIILINLGDAPFTVEPGMRIAQMIVAPAKQATFQLQAVLSETSRGRGGFGHTGTH
jgi:dUTP pyrophosphatase